jgi:hypothetical protein
MFFGDRGIESICIPRSVVEIPKWVFESGHKLTVVRIESEVHADA